MYHTYWDCPHCGNRMQQAQQTTHEAEGCNVTAMTIHQAKLAEEAERQAAAELRDGNVAALLHEWGTDATRGLEAEQQDAHVTVVANRLWAAWLREHGG